MVEISIHAPRAGRDAMLTQWRSVPWNFNPRAPCGARLPTEVQNGIREVFQSTRPVRGATQFMALPVETREFQSTRPVRGATMGILVITVFLRLFQSTRPVRGATNHLLLR